MYLLQVDFTASDASSENEGLKSAPYEVQSVALRCAFASVTLHSLAASLRDHTVLAPGLSQP